MRAPVRSANANEKKRYEFCDPNVDFLEHNFNSGGAKHENHFPSARRPDTFLSAGPKHETLVIYL